MFRRLSLWRAVTATNHGTHLSSRGPFPRLSLLFASSPYTQLCVVPHRPPPAPLARSQIKTLGRKDDKVAREMLEKTAWQVQPIMRKRGWRVKELQELKPEQKDRAGDNWNKVGRCKVDPGLKAPGFKGST